MTMTGRRSTDVGMLPRTWDDLRPAPYRVVLADDDPDYRWLVGRALQRSRCFEVVGAAEDGAELLEQVRDHDPDLVVVDHEMPGTDGLGVLRALQLERPDLPVVMLTALIRPSLYDDAMASGARAVVRKGSSLDHVVRQLAAVMVTPHRPWPDGDAAA